VNAGNAAVVAERLSQAMEALHAAAAISAAHRLGLLTALEAGPAGAEKLAGACQADAHRIRVLLDALVATGLAESTDDGCFQAGVPELSMLGLVGAGADLLIEAVRSGEAPLRCDVPAGATLVYPHAVSCLGALLATAAEAVADVLGGADQILDVGAGAAPWSLALAGRNPRCRVTALDLAMVLAVTRRAVAAAGHTDRFDYVCGDVFEVPLPPTAYDLVLLGNLCHLFDAPTNRRLFRRLRPAIRDGGRIAVVDVLPSPDAATQRSVRLYAAALMTRTSGGGVHDDESYRGWLEEAGFHDIRFHEASRTPPMSVVTGVVTGSV
jgi:ubiquinone/menaquinone biosynthesis C-methylase UbiE